MSDPSVYGHPDLECDVIMKGGATSGVVYPKAVLNLARRYRFRSIGGASAGAVAAAITAAAEYGRSTGGFDRIAEIPDEMGAKLASLFQPAKDARGIFAVVRLGGFDGRLAPAFLRALLAAWPGTVGGAVIGLVLTALVARTGDWLAIALGIVLTLFLAVSAGAVVFASKASRLLVKHDFGLCPGSTVDASGSQAITDWLAERIEIVAGRMKRGGPPPERPLLFGDLSNAFQVAPPGDPGEPAIDLRMMTTNLSMRRPNVLPNLGDPDYFFRVADFRALFPDWVVKYLVDTTEAVDLGLADPCHRFPKPAELPVVVAARMSLSFPFLISTVPLYRLDYSVDPRKPEPCKIFFSDGGISSNFPIHFFDGLLPRRPTFGVSLDDFDPRREERRVRLPMAPQEGQWIAIESVGGVFAFLMSIINAAKDWQDTLQSALPGYRERIVHVYLKETEGGLNLDMHPDTVGLLVNLGDRAGSLLTGQATNPADAAPFDFDDHRWRRFLVAFARLEETLATAARRWGEVGSGAGFGEFIQQQLPAPPSYGKSTLAWRNAIFARFDALMGHVRTWTDSPLRSDPQAHIPRPATDMRITPKP